MQRWTLRQALARAIEIGHDDGPKRLWFKILGETVYRRFLVVEDVLERPLPTLESIPDIEIRPIRENEIGEYVSLRSDQNAGEIANRLSRGHRCWVTRFQGRIVAAFWGVCERAFIEALDREFSLASDEIYTYDAFTDPNYRGLHLPAAGARVRRPIMVAEGFRRCLALLEPENEATVRQSRRAGYNLIGTVGYFGIGRWRRYFVRPTCDDSKIPSLVTRDPQ